MCNHNFLLHPGSLALSVSVSLCLAVSASLSSHLVLDLVEVMASAHISPPPPVTGSPGSRVEKEETTVAGLRPIGAAG